MTGSVDFSTIELDNSDFVLPEVVQGRVLHADGDIYAYNCAGNDDTTHEEVVFNLKAEVVARMQATGSTDYVLHITGDGSDKGKRHEVACLKQYQANRIDKPKPKNLAFARQYILTNMNSVAHYDQEADDGMAQAQQEAIDRGEADLSVIDSTDKDLRMIYGWHLCPVIGKLVYVTGYGECWYDSDKSKVLGWGTSFFWHQLLMGDTADNIPGLPDFGKTLTLKHWPTAPLVEARRRLSEGTMPSGKECTEKQLKDAEKKVQELEANVKPKPCGPVAVHEYLSNASSDKEALDLVEAAYQSHYNLDNFEFEDWRGRRYVRDWKKQMLEQAILLWIRPYKGASDVMRFFTLTAGV